MKTSLSTLPILLSISICAPISVRSASKTNSPAGAKPAVAAPLLTIDKSPKAPAPAITNGATAGTAEFRASELVRQIEVTESGAKAEFGRHKAYFTSGAADARPVTVIL